MGKIKGNVKEPEPAPIKPVKNENDTQGQIPIGTKLDLLDEHMTNDEHITELNLPVSDQANRLDHSEKPRNNDETANGSAAFSQHTDCGTPKNGPLEQHKENIMHAVVEKQIKERQSNHSAVNNRLQAGAKSFGEF